jgi:UDP-4-amino-4-deoxy-L-arabinose formyltransferase/UDP-glucuronic acid dehydrogenase (UDP-4-keto-hexauronic acid decarboxylating)
MTARPRLALAGGRRHGTACLGRLLELGADVCAVFGYPPTPSEIEVETPVSELARRAGIPYFDEPDLRKKPAKDLLRKLAPDVVLAVKWRRLFDGECLEIPRSGTFIIHDSLLPHLRGAAPLNWALILGEKETGATLFRAVEAVDAGPIAHQITIPVTDTDTAQTLEDKFVPVYAELAGRLALGLASGNLPLVPQDESRATFGTWRVPEDGVIDWNWSARRIHDFVRALAPPWPGATTRVDGRPCIVTRASVLADQDRWVGRVIGRVVEVHKGRGVAVLAGQGTVLVEELVLDGAAVPAATAIRSVKVTFGR